MIIVEPLTDQNYELISKTYTKLPESTPLDYLLQRMDIGGATLFSQYTAEGKLVYSGIFETCNAGINCLVGAGVEGEFNVIEMDTFLHWCVGYQSAVGWIRYKDHQPAIRLTGRSGWIKYLKPLGYSVVEKFKSPTSGGFKKCCIFEKKVNFELDRFLEVMQNGNQNEQNENTK